jgi:hypothetical protein
MVRGKRLAKRSEAEGEIEPDDNKNQRPSGGVVGARKDISGTQIEKASLDAVKFFRYRELSANQASPVDSRKHQIHMRACYQLFDRESKLIHEPKVLGLHI